MMGIVGCGLGTYTRQYELCHCKQRVVLTRKNPFCARFSRGQEGMASSGKTGPTRMPCTIMAVLALKFDATIPNISEAELAKVFDWV